VRLFVAVELPDPVRAALSELVAGLVAEPVAEGLTALRPSLPRQLRLAAPERMHLTLAFLGEVAEPRLPGLRERLGRSAGRHAPMRLRLAGGGRFGGSVLWVGVDGDVERLRHLAGSVAGAARHSGLAVEDRPYRPHVTLARARPPADLRPLAALLEGYEGPGWTASEIVLVRSRTGPSPEHVPVARWPLTGGPPASG
jgi:2'-5' RNA ligase